MQLLVTGGSGSLSKVLLSRILEQGHRVFLLEATEFPHPRVQCFGSLGEARFDFRMLDAILDLAGPSPGDEVDRHKILHIMDSTRTLLIRAEKASVPKYIHVSSYRIPGRSHPFAALKQEQEHLIKNSGIPYLILRAPWIIGPTDRFISPLIQTIASRKPLWLDHLDHLPIPMITQRELADTLLEALYVRLNVSRVYEIASFAPMELATLVSEIGFLLGQTAAVTVNETNGIPLPWEKPALDLIRARMAGTPTAYYMDFDHPPTSHERVLLEIIRETVSRG